MEPAVRQLIEALHCEGRYQYVMALTGGGTGAVAQLLNVPGGSRTLLEVIVPYAERAFCEFLGHTPEQFCSPATAQAMAIRARERARWLAPGRAVAGIACTASLATDRPKRGDHRAHLAIATDLNFHTARVVFAKGRRDRAGEETLLDALLLNGMARVLGGEGVLELPLLPGDDVTVDTPLSPIPTGRGWCVTADGQHLVNAPLPPAILPGAFNPLHKGHLELARIAAGILGTAVAFELSTHNVDKEALTPDVLRHRLAQFTWRAPLWVTSAPTFVEKARLFPGTVFVVGVDTAARLFLPRYYDDGERGMFAALEEIRGLGCRFLVACRVGSAGQCVYLDDLGLPGAYRDLFQAIPAEHFRVDVSSTHLRGQAGNPAPPRHE